MIVPEGKKNGPIILVELTGEPVNAREATDAKNKADPTYNTWPEWKKNHKFYLSVDVTLQKGCIFDTRTNMYSDVSIYESTKGLYIKKQGKRFYLKDFK